MCLCVCVCVCVCVFVCACVCLLGGEGGCGIFRKGGIQNWGLFLKSGGPEPSIDYEFMNKSSI